ncbi:phosphotransferase [Bifidobacterium aquikefiricola]|uniref:Phosphotransferase n=1 Tax=Bifidobacterium aquikefiricola TaxID=3059038 RepID=A0AB39U4X5_9BIFI
MTIESNLTLAALASATMPNIAVSGISDGEQLSAQDIAAGIRTAVIRDTSGRLYDVIAAAKPQGKKLLKSQVQAAQALSRARETAGLGFSIERIVSYQAGDNPNASTGSTAVVMAAHCEGHPRKLGALTIDECMAVGTAIGAIHRMRPNFLKDESYPCYATEHIHKQLTGWIRTLAKAGHIPQEITSSWAQIVETEGLWSFNTCMVHGGFHDGDIIFNGSNLTGIHRWQNMQMNDPARDLAWIFAKLDEEHRNALLSSYGRMMGSRLDSLIMLRANLWLQMEKVSDLIQALDSANNDAIVTFRAEVERLAHQIAMKNVDMPKAPVHRNPNPDAPSTITVGSLLASESGSDASHNDAAAASQSVPQSVSQPAPHALNAAEQLDKRSDLNSDNHPDDHPTEVVQAAEVTDRHQQDLETIVIPVQELHDAVGEHNQTKDNS